MPSRSILRRRPRATRNATALAPRDIGHPTVTHTPYPNQPTVDPVRTSHATPHGHNRPPIKNSVSALARPQSAPTTTHAPTAGTATVDATQCPPVHAATVGANTCAPTSATPTHAHCLLGSYGLTSPHQGFTSIAKRQQGSGGRDWSSPTLDASHVNLNDDSNTPAT